jgi:UDP-N-acetylglucosamine 1-carboxyvinyltransferase
MPGGCNFGVRPIDQHIKGFNALGARVEVKSGIIHADTQEHGIKGNHVYLDIASVGATINIMLAAVLGEGRTVIENAAKEPHIVDVANFLNSMGADIKGAGTSLIKIDGVSGLHGGFYSIIPDQIEAGTYVAAVAGTGGEILIKNVIPKHLECITAKFQEMGIYIEERGDAVLVGRDKPLKNANVKTMFYPGFPTDMQPQITAVLCQAEGTSIITEEVYKDSNRFKYVEELKKMGAHIHVDGRIAIVQGVEKLTGAPVKACDLRAGAAMVIAGLCAQGRTDIEDIYHIERGYENIVSKLRGLGASIARVKVSSPDEGVLREVLA